MKVDATREIWRGFFLAVETQSNEDITDLACTLARYGATTALIARFLRVAIKEDFTDTPHYEWLAHQAWALVHGREPVGDELGRATDTPIDFLRTLLDPQPDPINATADDVWQEIIDELPEHLLFLKPYCVERRQQGIERYGVPLSRSNGRDHLVDAVQEGLDMAVYMKAEGCPDWKEPLELVSSLMWRMAAKAQ